MKKAWWKAAVLSVMVVVSFSGCDFLNDLIEKSPDGADISGDISWDEDAIEFRDFTDQTFTFTLPAGGTEYPIWGTGISTDDSSIGTAAVHAGLISFAEGGTVIILVLPGQESYTGSTQNGVTSMDWDAYVGSFEFVTE